MKGSSAEVEMKTPEVKVSGKETSPSKFKMPTFKLPKFGVSTPSSTVEVPVPEKNLKIDGEEEILAVTIAAPSIDTQEPSIDIKTTGTEREGKGSKFKLPSLGFSPPHVKGPEIDLSVSKKDVEMSLPEAKGKIELPDVKLKKPSAEVEITTPEIKVSGKETSPSKFKMPSFKLPKFGVSTPSSTVEVPVTDKNLKIDGEEEILAVTIAAPDIDTQEPTIDIKTTGTEHEGKGSKFKLPSLGFSTPHVKGPEIDFSASKKDVEMSLPEAKGKIELPDVELKKPSAEVEIKTPEIKVSGKETSPSKFKMPSFKLPKFGVSTPSSTVEVPVTDKNLKIDGEEEILAVTITAPNIDTQGPSIDIKTTGTEHEGKGSKFKLPSLGFSTPHVKGPQIDLSVSKKDVDVTIPEGKADVQLPGVELKEPSVKVETEASGTEVQSSDVEGSPSKFKMPSFKLPKFGTTSPQISVEVPEVDGADLKLPEVKAAVKLPDIEVKEPVVSLSASEAPMAEGDASAKKTSWTLPKFSFSKTSIKGPEADVNLDTPKVDVALPETKTEIHPPDIDANISSSISVEGAPSTDIDPTLKKTRFSLPKFSFSKQSTKELDVDISLPEAAVSLPEGYVKVKPPAVELKPTESEIELDGQENKFKMPRFGISMPRVKGPEIDLSLSKKNIDVTLPENKAEVQMPDVKTKQLTPKVEIKTPEIEAQKSHAEASPSKLKMPTFTLPKFGATTPKVSVQVPDVEKDIEIDGAVDVTAPSIDIEGQSVDVKAKGIETEGSGSKFKMPHFGISKPKIKGPEIDLTLSTKRADVTLQGAKAEVALPSVEVKKAEGAISVPAHASLPEGEIKVRQPAVEMKTPELQQDVQGSKFKMPKFGITLPKAKGPEADLKVFQQDVDVTLPEVKAEVKLPEVHTKESSASVETEAKSKDAGGSPLKFKMPTVKMPKIGGVSVERSDAALSTETTVAEPKEDFAVSIKGPSITIKTDVPKTLDSETQKTQTDGAGLVSPSKFKLPSFKMPKLSFSRKPEDEYVPEEEDQLKMDIKTQEEIKSPKRTLTSFGEIFKNIDVEFDVPEIEQEEENLETSKAVQKTAKPTEIELQAKDSERNKKQDTIKSPERTGWFKFPKFGLSSPSEPAKFSEKDQQKDEKSPAGETGDEEVSPTCSVQSSDAFADISSAMTSEHLGLSSSSPTKVTVKYTGPDVTAGFEEIRSNIITSTTSTGLISVEPNLPEKITILSSGVSSSSEDTLRLESGKIHVITSNIQATPEAQHAKVVTAIQVQSSGGLPLESEASKAASWTVEESQSSKKSILGKYFVRGTSTEISETKETIVITKQITRTSEPISGETASSIQRLRDSVHSEKMKFFDGAEK
ncbi:neuroblast differentiation-associated protein AHNAK-like [Echeneis naucrates]|uniref:neuroblast differentiation-associated protein AHNAK-like n=1 Tax=Echeneis naucrates TaxID=173247 RepID=UPI001113A844|nr:neuroblast differentiation-associated protein AHNAK-like [Echeneis naucrates]